MAKLKEYNFELKMIKNILFDIKSKKCATLLQINTNFFHIIKSQ